MATQLPLPIDFAPRVVRDHGYNTAHPYPLVSHGKDEDGFAASFRVSPAEAWQYPSLELRAGSSWPAIILDIDRRDARHDLIERVDLLEDVPRPNWHVERAESGGLHVVWCLASPVYRGAKAREKPLKLLARVSEWLAQTLQADRGYRGVLTHNPYGRAKGRKGLTTRWGSRSAYELQDLALYIPKGWRLPQVPLTAEGRNCGLFRALMSFAGHTSSMRADLYAQAKALSPHYVDGQGLELPDAEIRGIARSVERYRARWIAQGRYGGDPKKQAARGRRSGEARRKRTAERDEEIIRLKTAGLREAQIADLVGLTQQAVNYIARRDMPRQAALEKFNK